jgi:hypothetical protein
MRKLLVIMAALGTLPTFASVLECNIESKDKTFKFKQQVNSPYFGSLLLGDVLERDNSLDSLESNVIAAKDNIRVSLEQEHTNIVSLMVTEKIEGKIRPHFISKNLFIDSERKYQVNTVVYIDGQLSDQLKINCNIK